MGAVLTKRAALATDVRFIDQCHKVMSLPKNSPGIARTRISLYLRLINLFFAIP